MTISISRRSLRAVAALSLVLGLGAHAGGAAAARPDAGLDTAALMKDLTTLASPSLAGRLTGTAGNRAAQAYITRRLRQLGVQPFGTGYAQPFAFAPKAGPASEQAPNAREGINLIGRIPGTRYPERCIVVSAHYDHLGQFGGAIYAGADDNASGVAALLAVAAWFKRHPPQNTIVFAAFDAEEQGMQGSRHFVRQPPFPLGQVVLNLNFDMVSRNERNQLYVAGTHHRPGLRPLVAAAAATSSVELKLGHDNRAALASPQDDWTTQSDHAAFHQAGIPFLYFGVEDHPDYHKPGDTADKIDGAFFANVARLLVRTASIADQNLEQIQQAAASPP